MKRLAITFSLSLSYLLVSATGEDSTCKKFEHLSYVYAELNGLGKANKYLDSLSSCSATPASLFSKARMLYKEKKYADALVLFEKYSTEPGIEQNQKATAFNYAGICANNLAQYTKALGYYTLAEENGFSKTIINYNKGIAYKNDGNIDAAIKAYNSVLELDSKYANAWNNLGILYENQGEMELACSYYATACNVNEGYDPLNMINYAKALRELEKYDSALIINQLILEKHPEYYDADIELAKLYSHDFFIPKKAIVYARKAINADRENADALFQLAFALSSLGIKDSSLYYYSKVLEFNPQEYVAYTNSSTIYALYGYFDKAIEYNLKALEIKPNYTYAYRNLANEYLYMHDFENGLKYSQLFYNFSTYPSEGALSLGYAFLQKGEYENAIPYLYEAIPLKDYPADIPLNNLGLTYLRLNNLDSAKYYLDAAYSINPNNSFIYHNRALYYYKLNNYTSACSDLKTSLDKEYNWIIDTALVGMVKNHCPEVNLNRVIKLHGYKGHYPEFSDKKFIELIDSLSLTHFENNLQAITDVNKKVIKEDVGQKPMQASNFVVYPNPTSESITISNGSAVNEVYSVDIYNFNGQKVLSSGTNTGSTKINLSAFAKGIYVAIVLQNNNVVHSEKVVVE